MSLTLPLIDENCLYLVINFDKVTVINSMRHANEYLTWCYNMSHEITATG